MILSDAYIRFKIRFNIHLPIRNNFYKGRRISIREKWFCKEFQQNFDPVPWETIKNKRMTEVAYPSCNSKSVHWSGKLFRAKVDGTSSFVLLDITNNPER